MAINVNPEDLDVIVQNLGRAQVSGIIAPPGTGKSTTVIKHLYNAVEQAKIFVVEPTIIACANLRNYMSSQFEAMGAPKAAVGMAAEGEVHYTNKRLAEIRQNSIPTEPDTGVVYCTGGHMHKIMLNLVQYANRHAAVTLKGTNFTNVNLRFCNILMVDEAHSGSVDNDMIMYLYAYLRRHGAQLPRLLVSSATLNIQETPFPDAPIYRIPVKSFPVNIEYHTRPYRADDRNLYSDTTKVLIQRHQERPLPPTGADAWLVFCAGSQEVETVVTGLSTTPGLEVLSAYSNLGPEMSNRIFAPVPKGQRRVIVATNIAEVAITVDNLSGIFDTLTEKYAEESASGGFRLGLHLISKSSAEQRAGRTGRTTPGFCYRMTTSSEFHNLPQSRPKEMERVPLYNIVIELLDLGIDPTTLLKVDRNRVAKACTLLKSLAMYSTPPFAVTMKGRFASNFEFSVQGSATLYEWAQDRSRPIFPALVMLALVENFGPSYFWYPRKLDLESKDEYQDRLLEHRTTFFARFDGSHDLATLGNVWLDFYTALLPAGITSLEPNRKSVAEYAAANSLNNRKLLDLCKSLKTSVATLQRLGYHVTIGPFNIERTLQLLLPFMKTGYQDRIFVRMGGILYRSRTDTEFYNLESRVTAVRNLEVPITANEILALITFERPSQYNVVRLISLAAPVTEVVAVPNLPPIAAPQTSATDSKPDRRAPPQAPPRAAVSTLQFAGAQIMQGSTVTTLPDITTNLPTTTVTLPEWILATPPAKPTVASPLPPLDFNIQMAPDPIDPGIIVVPTPS
jgi:HrpA-like RNA helicase